MDFPSRKALIKKQIRISDVDASTVSTEAVDTKLLDMWRSLQIVGDELGFTDKLSSCIQKIAYDLRLAHHLIRQEDHQGLDQLAQGLSQNALKIGATRLLSAAIEMQGLARIGDLIAVEDLVQGLENELRIVEKQFA
ncbi:MAG: hypothetical protein NTX25_06120 [Proteobacteria bacterium]|nr:hypothetical protein [Pseudomonadota bacterium]